LAQTRLGLQAVTPSFDLLAAGDPRIGTRSFGWFSLETNMAFLNMSGP